MPLHLLGKKSWNVYNADNIARVKRDEAAAKAAEEAEEQRMQEVDAERRLAILRGEEPPPLPPPSEDKAIESSDRTRESIPGRERKKRKRAGEDDTDFELRVAKERTLQVQVSNRDSAQRKTSDAPIVGRDGHFDLFGHADKARRTGKNEEAEADKRKTKKEVEDQYTMRFANAAGKDGAERPWYSHATSESAELVTAETVGKDAFGREDPGRKKRDADRITSNDPLAMMKRGAAKVREVKQERRKFQEERDRELKQLRKEEKRRERSERERRHARSEDYDSRRRHDEREDRHARRRRDDRHGRDDQRHGHSTSNPHGDRDRERPSRFPEQQREKSAHSGHHDRDRRGLRPSDSGERS